MIVWQCECCSWVMCTKHEHTGLTFSGRDGHVACHSVRGSWPRGPRHAAFGCITLLLPKAWIPGICSVCPRHYHTSAFMNLKKQIPLKLAKLESHWSLPFPFAIPWKILIHTLPTHPSDCLHTPQALTAAEGLEQSWLCRGCD